MKFKSLMLSALLLLASSFASATLINVNTAGASANTIDAKSGSMQIAITGTWAGATVALQRYLSDGTWQTVASFTSDSFQTVDVVRDTLFRFNTTGSPTLKCDVLLTSGQIN